MFEKSQRLNQEKQFKQTMSKGKKVTFPDFTWFYFLKEGQKKFGIVIPNRVIAKAVLRNKFRRQIKSFVLRNLKELPQGWHVVLMKQPPQDLIKDLKKLLNKI